FKQMRRTSPLGTYLNNFVILSCRSENCFTFHYVYADRFLQIKVSACLDRVNGLKCMPVIRSSNQYNVHLVFGQHFSIVIVSTRFLLRLKTFTYHRRGFIKFIFVDIAQSHDINGSNLDQTEKITLSVPSCPDQSNLIRLLRIDYIHALGTKCRKCKRCSCALKKASSVNVKILHAWSVESRL